MQGSWPNLWRCEDVLKINKEKNIVFELGGKGAMTNCYFFCFEHHRLYCWSTEDFSTSTKLVDQAVKAKLGHQFRLRIEGCHRVLLLDGG